MTYEDIKALISELADAIGCGYDYYQHDDEHITPTPYLLFEMPESSDTYADNGNYAEKTALNIEYDSKAREIDTEKRIEGILAAHGLVWSKTLGYVTGQAVTQVMYSMEVYING